MFRFTRRDYPTLNVVLITNCLLNADNNFRLIQEDDLIARCRSLPLFINYTFVKSEVRVVSHICLIRPIPRLLFYELDIFNIFLRYERSERQYNTSGL